MEERIQNLIDFSQNIYQKKMSKDLHERYAKDIENITPQDVMLVQYEQMKMGMTAKEMLSFVDKLMNVFNKPLRNYQWEKPEKETFLYHLMKENQGLIERLEEFKSFIRGGDLKERKGKLGEFINEIRTYNEHLIKLENILFPYLEKKMERFEGLKIMWALHDEVRMKFREFQNLLDKEDPDEQEINRGIGQLYFYLYGLVQKQELILFPSAAELLDKETFEEMLEQSFEYSFPFMEKPKTVSKVKKVSKIKYDLLRKIFVTDTGHFDLEQLALLFNVLPLDLTLVDEHDKVAYFSKPKERIFPRSAAIIGRDVRNCHPPDSVHVVEAILEAFKKGEKDEASFWLQRKGMFIYIQYIALRDEGGRYKGVLEISQEISGLKALEGEHRLLEW